MFFVYGNPMLGNVYKKIPAISVDIKVKAKLVGLHMRANDTSHASRRWYGLTLAKGFTHRKANGESFYFKLRPGSSVSFYLSSKQDS